MDKALQSFFGRCGAFPTLIAGAESFSKLAEFPYPVILDTGADMAFGNSVTNADIHVQRPSGIYVIENSILNSNDYQWHLIVFLFWLCRARGIVVKCRLPNRRSIG